MYFKPFFHVVGLFLTSHNICAAVTHPRQLFLFFYGTRHQLNACAQLLIVFVLLNMMIMISDTLSVNLNCGVLWLIFWNL